MTGGRCLAALALTLAAGSAAARERDLLAGRVAGKPADCITLSRVQGPAIQRDGSILYTQSGARVWRTRPIGLCPSLNRNVVLIVDVQSGDRICRNDRFRTVTPPTTIPSGFCRFDRFTPYDRPR